ncbi:RdRP-domain-containing protein [Auriscalpium vulgare]|uniref:RdRP-domain-containing protein n=1 Tax=Auriscalpium vulgare TaxID=40419 RepID=A0ACB8S565_9AGAM|nr:RdRP-domain-containing protein [Auriscalpium vulgare]
MNAAVERDCRGPSSSHSVFELRMDIFMKNINFQVSVQDLHREVVNILHNHPYTPMSQTLPNFEINLHPPRNGRAGRNRGTGILSLPSEAIGSRFLQEFGGERPAKRFAVAGRTITVFRSNKPTSRIVLERLGRPYRTLEAAQRERDADHEQATVSIRAIQFGWETRDGIISIEWEKAFDAELSSLTFKEERREVSVEIIEPNGTKRLILMPFSQVHWCAAGTDEDHRPIISFHLLSRPVFHLQPSQPGMRGGPTPVPVSDELLGGGLGFDMTSFAQMLADIFGHTSDSTPKRHRVLSLYPNDEHHARVLPYASLVVRLVAVSDADVNKFRRLCRNVQPFRRPESTIQHADHLGRFSKDNFAELRTWLLALKWPVAFRVDSILKNLLADIPELLSIREHITRMLAEFGSARVAALLQRFEHALFSHDWSASQQSFQDIFLRSAKGFESREISPTKRRESDDLFDCYHVSVTPTGMMLEGPVLERSNRVMRTYADNHDSFLRLTFVEETNLQYRQDRDIDVLSFIHLWVRNNLHNGVVIAGRLFHFLAYSQSALKSHTVWMVKDFRDSTGVVVTAAEIIQGLGTFDNLSFDRDLMRCPARYGARISQSFTATESSVSVEVDEILYEPDIECPETSWVFTDGVGTLSLEMAQNIWTRLQRSRKRAARRALASPKAFQIRFKGSKGVISVDHKLPGRVLVLRPSMIKFESPDSRDVDIAQAFVRPSKYFLNRPLIMLLEGLNVPYMVFERLQDAVVREVDEASQSLVKAAKIFDQYGLGNSYGLSQTLQQLHKLGITNLMNDTFYAEMVRFATHHIRRDLRSHARIPVKDGYTLVGVADVHYYLQPDHVFACISDPVTRHYRYLEGPMLISRSPTIHPGDVQKVHAIGKPPPGSPFAKEPLPNTVVFSVKGTRPLPSKLGGGDLDGDVYNVTTFADLLPPGENQDPAAYTAVERLLLDRPSNMRDVADFVADYMVNDVLGLVATNWLLIADSNGRGCENSNGLGIKHPDCIELAKLHSDAVDYPKSGRPVSIKDVPYLKKGQRRPDWCAPETVDAQDDSKYYTSMSAIGRLFRRIDLPVLGNEPHRARGELEVGLSYDDIIEQVARAYPKSPLYNAVEKRVAEFIPTEVDEVHMSAAAHLLEVYADELQVICASNSLSRHRSAAMLTEEESTVGTIVAQCSQPRWRKDVMTRLRDQTDYLVKRIREEFEYEDDSDEDWLERGWAAWKVACICDTAFGAKSFGWIALKVVFDAIREIEQNERRQTTGRR